MLSNIRRKENFSTPSMCLCKQLLVLILLSFFSITSWTQAFVQQGNKLVASDVSTLSSQGQAVAVSADGNTAIVGAPGDNNRAGAALIYIKSNNVWVRQGPKLVGTGAVGNGEQGYSVDISNDGNTAVVGGRLDGSGTGAVWVFKRTNGVWSQVGDKLVGTGLFGSANQGTSVAISGDGNTVIAGGPLDQNNQGGAAWVFVYGNEQWSQQGQKLVATGSFSSIAQQGFSVDISFDGNTAIVGAPADNSFNGGAWIYKRVGDTWAVQGAKLFSSGTFGISRQGWSVAISGDAKTAIIGGPSDNGGQISGNPFGFGGAWVFVESNGNWAQQGSRLTGSTIFGFPGQGSSVSLSFDGSVASIGARNDNGTLGAAWVFKRTNGFWQQFGQKLVGVDTRFLSAQGQAVALSSDGKTLMVGGPTDNSGDGAAWVYVLIPRVNISDINANENAGTANISICLSESTNQPVTVQYAPSHGKAKADSDYVALPGTVTIPAGQTCVTVPVTIIDDSLTEGNEDAVFRIFNATNAVIGDAYGAINIIDNDALPPVITPVDFAFGEQDAIVEISLCVGVFDKPVTVTYRTRALTATAGLDYADTTATITKMPGTGPCLTAKVRLLTDNLDSEDREQFEIVISDPVNARIIDSVAVVEIVNIPAPLAAVTISDATVNENAGAATLFINLSKPISTDITVNYSTANVTAIAGTDFFQSTNFSVVIPAGQTSAAITISLIDDVAPEPTESFNVVINNISMPSSLRINIEDRYGAVNILDNDVIGTQPTIRITSQRFLKEGINNSVALEVCLSSPSSETVTVEYVTSNGSATAGTDYTYKQSFVRIYPGATCTTLSIPINDDELIEDSEYFTVRLVNPANATSSFSNIAYIYIEDNDNIVCPTGAICYRTYCPSTTANLNSTYSIYQLPPSTVVSWHTGTPATDANRLTPAQAQAVGVSGFYYASIYSSVTGCYTPTLQVVVNIVSCGTNAPFAQTGNTIKEPAAREKAIIPSTVIAPNPFNNGFNVAIHSEKSTEAVVTVVDIYGRQVQTQKLVLNAGKNNVAVNPAAKMPPGNYFLKIKAGERNEVHKLVKQ